MDDTLLTREEAADVLKVSRNTMFRLLREGQIRASKVGATWRVRKSDLDRYLARNAQ